MIFLTQHKQWPADQKMWVVLSGLAIGALLALAISALIRRSAGFKYKVAADIAVMNLLDVDFETRAFLSLIGATTHVRVVAESNADKIPLWWQPITRAKLVDRVPSSASAMISRCGVKTLNLSLGADRAYQHMSKRAVVIVLMTDVLRVWYTHIICPPMPKVPMARPTKITRKVL